MYAGTDVCVCEELYANNIERNPAQVPVVDPL